MSGFKASLRPGEFPVTVNSSQEGPVCKADGGRGFEREQ